MPQPLSGLVFNERHPVLLLYLCSGLGWGPQACYCELPQQQMDRQRADGWGTILVAFKQIDQAQQPMLIALSV